MARPCPPPSVLREDGDDHTLLSSSRELLGFHRPGRRHDYPACTAPAAKSALVRGRNGLPPASADEHGLPRACTPQGRRWRSLAGHLIIIHMDIKPSNILLDEKTLKIGLCISKTLCGGYMALKYVSTGKLMEKSDVFSFEVVLLDLITGRKLVNSFCPIYDESLAEWEFEVLLYPRLAMNCGDVLCD